MSVTPRRRLVPLKDRMGHYSQSLYKINQLLNMKAKGVSLHDRYHKSSKEYLTHAMRVDEAYKSNSLLALQYSGLIARGSFLMLTR